MEIVVQKVSLGGPKARHVCKADVVLRLAEAGVDVRLRGCGLRVFQKDGREVRVFDPPSVYTGDGKSHSWADPVWVEGSGRNEFREVVADLLAEAAAAARAAEAAAPSRTFGGA